MRKLKPCPFCRGEAELCYMPALWGYALYVSCKGCDAKSPRNWQEKEPKLGDAEWKVAADQWNRRPGETAETCGMAYCEHYPEGLPVCAECREASTLSHDMACAKLADARAEIERLVSEIENKQYTITCADEENQQLKESLAEARTEIENLKWHVSNEKAKAETALALNDKALGLVNEVRARLDILERTYDSLIEEQASLCAKGQSITELVAAKCRRIEQMRDALLAARGIIEEGSADLEADLLQPDKVIGQIDAVLQSIPE